MSEFQPVETKQDLENLNEDEIVAGYRHGLSCADEPGSDKSRGFWHGWRNAQADKGRLPIDIHMQRLVNEIVGSRRNAH